MGVLGTDTTLETASWCWIDPRTPHTLLWQFVTGKFLEIVAYITTVVLYASIKVFLRKQVIISCMKHCRMSKSLWYRSCATALSLSVFFSFLRQRILQEIYRCLNV